MNVTLIGMGSGQPENLTLQGLAALRQADLILGARRLLAVLPAGWRPSASAPGCCPAFPASSCWRRRWAVRGRSGTLFRPMAAPVTRWPSVCRADPPSSSPAAAKTPPPSAPSWRQRASGTCRASWASASARRKRSSSAAASRSWPQAASTA